MIYVVILHLSRLFHQILCASIVFGVLIPSFECILLEQFSRSCTVVFIGGINMNERWLFIKFILCFHLSVCDGLVIYVYQIAEVD